MEKILELFQPPVLIHFLSFLKSVLRLREPNLLPIVPALYSLVHSLVSILNLISPWQIILIPFVFVLTSSFRG